MAEIPPAKQIISQKGTKWHLVADSIDRKVLDFAGYDSIWFPDEDIDLSTNDVNRLFEIFETHKLSIAQPSIRKGDLSYLSTIQKPWFVFRRSHFVEVMCPLFSRSAIEQCIPFFKRNVSGWGIDLLWSHRFGADRMGVIDEVPVVHTRRMMTGQLYKQLSTGGVSPEQELVGINQVLPAGFKFRMFLYVFGLHFDSGLISDNARRLDRQLALRFWWVKRAIWAAYWKARRRTVARVRGIRERIQAKMVAGEGLEPPTKGL